MNILQLEAAANEAMRAEIEPPDLSQSPYANSMYHYRIATHRAWNQVVSQVGLPEVNLYDVAEHLAGVRPNHSKMGRQHSCWWERESHGCMRPSSGFYNSILYRGWWWFRSEVARVGSLNDAPGLPPEHVMLADKWAKTSAMFSTTRVVATRDVFAWKSGRLILLARIPDENHGDFRYYFLATWVNP